MIACDQETFYHDVDILFDTAEVMVKVCKRCKTKWEFTKDNKGRIDNDTYLDIHARNFLQRGHRHYEREFGKPKALQFNDAKMRESQKHNENFNEENEARFYNSNVF